MTPSTEEKAAETEAKNLELMQTLDDAWNTQEWTTFRNRHAATVRVSWPGGRPATVGRDAHHDESVEFFKTFPDNRVENRPYKVLFARGEWTCSIARFSGTMAGPMARPDGTTIAPTHRHFRTEFCTVAHWMNGQIVEENLFYDLIGVMQQIGLA